MSVGDELTQARIAAGRSVDDVSADTRIRAGLITAIEADDFRQCGGAVYARGHIRSIARSIGVDPEPLVAEFDRTHEVAPRPVAVAAQPTDHDIVARSDRRAPNWTAAMAAALVFICIVAGIGLVKGHTKSPSQSNASEGQSTQPTTSPQPSTGATQPAIPPVTPLTADRASMAVRTTHGQTWISITTKSGHVLFEGLLQPGQQKRWTDKRGLVFVIGNAPAVDVVVNGHDIGSPPSSGNVSRGHVSPGADSVQHA